MSCKRCNDKPEFSTVSEIRYALVNDVAEAKEPEKISSLFKFDDPVSAGRLRLKYPDMRVVQIVDRRRLKRAE